MTVAIWGVLHGSQYDNGNFDAAFSSRELAENYALGRVEEYCVWLHADDEKREERTPEGTLWILGTDFVEVRRILVDSVGSV